MHQAGARSASALLSQRTPRGDRAMRGLIVGGGISVLLLLAWAHLGLGALVVPPPSMPAQMSAATDEYAVTVSAGTGQLVAGDGNVLFIRVLDRAGYPITAATVRVHADMTTMAMPVPDVTATAQGPGRYRSRLLFTMAGTWRLTVTVLVPSHAAEQVTFDVGVRWR